MDASLSPLSPSGDVHTVTHYSLGKRLVIVLWVSFACLIAGMMGLSLSGALFGTIAAY